jgi:hypothetical protein
MYHALRGMILRYRKQNKTDSVAVSTFAYEKGMSKKDVEELYIVLLEAEKLPKIPEPSEKTMEKVAIPL